MSWVGLLYILAFLFGDAFTTFFVEKRAPFPIGIYLMLLLIYCGLFVGGGVFFLQCKLIAYEIKTNDMMNFDVSFYLWGKTRFSNKDIKSIELHTLRGIKKYITPFDMEKKNFKVNLLNGRCVYLSGSMKDVDFLVERWNQKEFC